VKGVLIGYDRGIGRRSNKFVQAVSKVKKDDLEGFAAPVRLAGKVTPGTRIYAIGDIHGRWDLLAPLLARIEEHVSLNPSARPLAVFLGDYVDRGPCSRQVINQLLQLNERLETVFLKGNHEEYLMKFLTTPSFLKEWLRWGGLDTLRSYDFATINYSDSSEREFLATSLRVILQENGHLDFLRSLKPWFVCGDFFFAHAGVRPGVPLDQQREKDLLEIRDDFLRSELDFGKIIVHGHTPVLTPDLRPNRINVDTGAYATGKLTCAVIDGNELMFM
jgi:serine/threonine protein phosphatase 1